jgi:thiosulfate/3-mercaptopyruvate sulfurtransferase
MSYAKPDALTSTDWLASHLNDSNLRVIDATWYLPGQGKKGADDFAQSRIPGAVYWDLDAIADTSSDLPVTIPSAEVFAAAMKRLGIGPATHVVAYDRSGIMSAARVWWMLRYFGHDKVSVLDGGFPKWQKENRSIETSAPRAPAAAGEFVARPRPELIRTFGPMMDTVRARASQVVDARGAARYAGTEKETRPNTRSGHMPGSLNLPFGNILDGASKTVLPADQLAERFRAAGVDVNEPIVVSCGSGVSSPVLALGLYLLGRPDVAVYDGSWNEWGRNPEALIEGS